ncbi:MAG: hypothetical protein KF678_05170 [Phycisphaeraceae bacterium]|nr:hypothetical protein [Phycisphaeraceae bacterium]
MKILLDQGTPVPLRKLLDGHEVMTAFEMGWSELVNGELLTRAEEAFDLLITTDQNLPYQQNLTRRRLGILVLTTTSWPRVQKHAQRVVEAIATIQQGQFVVVAIPD